jgi:L-lactate dehydrogenase
MAIPVEDSDELLMEAAVTAAVRRSSEARGRVAVVGAGSVGSTIAYAVMLRGLAGEILLTDMNAKKAEAEVRDLNHGLRFVPSVRVSAGSIQDCAGSEIVVITAGAKQKPGQTRLDLAHTNVGIFRELIPALAAAAPEAIFLIVSNPVDVLTYAAAKWHPCGARCVLGSGTVLDSSRFVTLIAERIGVSVANVHAQMVGEHGESELPLWSSAHVGNIPLSEFRATGHHSLTAEDRAEIIASVRSAAAEIIAAKGATNWAIGLAASRIIEAIRRNENAILTVSRLLNDYAGARDVCLSVPCVVNRNGAERPLAVPMNEEELAGLRESARVVKEACNAAGL